MSSTTRYPNSSSVKNINYAIKRRNNNNNRKVNSISQIFETKHSLDHYSKEAYGYMSPTNMSASTLRSHSWLKKSLSNSTHELSKQSSLSKNDSPSNNDISSFLNISSSRNGKNKLKNIMNGSIHIDSPFLEIHKSVSVEYEFEYSKPLLCYKRHLVKSGKMKIIENQEAVIEAFLFSDCLVYGKVFENNLLQEQTIITFEKLEVEEIQNMNIFRVKNQVKNITFENYSLEETEEWTLVLQSVLSLYRSVKEIKEKHLKLNSLNSNKSNVSLSGFKVWSRRNSSTSNSRRNSLFESIKTIGSTLSKKSSFNGQSDTAINNMERTQWIHDDDVSICMECNATKFNMIIRKHHCRVCGHIICYNCYKQLLDKRKNKVKMCMSCIGSSVKIEKSQYFTPLSQKKNLMMTSISTVDECSSESLCSSKIEQLLIKEQRLKHSSNISKLKKSSLMLKNKDKSISENTNDDLLGK